MEVVGGKEPRFGSQDDALLHQACETFESEIAAAPMEVENVEYNFGSESQDRALNEACEAYEQSISASTSSAISSPCPSNSLKPTESITISSNSKSATSTPESFTSTIIETTEAAPMPRQLRLGNTYLTVSNLVSQLWCEQQMAYNFWKPDLKAVIESTPSIAPAVVAAVTAVGTAAKRGNKLHKKRDRAVNKYVPVVTKTREDEYGIRLINTIHSIRSLLVQGKPCIREIAIFGMPLGEDILVVGTVDELKFNSRDQLELVEFKTRADVTKPIRGAQLQAYKMQTMVYKRMLDDLVRGCVDGHRVLDHLRLRPSRALNDELLQVVRKLGIGLDGATEITLGQLMAAVLQQFQFLPSVQVLTLEFSNRDGREAVAKETVEFDSDWLQQRLQHCLAYWSREREAVGVDIEDTWKCRICAFIETCEWRSKMNDIYAQKNNLRRIQPK